MTTLVVAEHDHGSLKGATLNTVTAALQCGGEVHVLVAGANAAGAAQAAAQIPGVAKVLHADAPCLAEQLAENVAAQVLAVAREYTHVLFPATAHGKNVAPRVAALLDVAQISDAMKVLSADTFERPIYAGNAIATVQSLDAIKVLTVRTTGFDPRDRRTDLASTTIAIVDTKINAMPQPARAVAAFTVGVARRTQRMALPIRSTRCLHYAIVIDVGAIQHTSQARTTRGFGNTGIASATGTDDAITARTARRTIATIKCASTKRDAHVASAL